MPVELNKSIENMPYTIPSDTQINNRKIKRNDPCPCGSKKSISTAAEGDYPALSLNNDSTIANPSFKSSTSRK